MTLRLMYKSDQVNAKKKPDFFLSTLAMGRPAPQGVNAVFFSERRA